MRQVAPVATIVLLVALVLVVPLPVIGAEPQERHVTITAHSFAYEPGTLHVNRGDTVIIRLESEDVVHGLYVDGYGVATEAEPGRPGELRFVADRTGSFRVRCSISCGNLHPFMIGKLVVGPNLAWLRAALATLVTTVGVFIAAGVQR